MSVQIEECPYHTRDAFNISTMPLIVKWAEEICYTRQVDAIAACGHSGLVLAGALSYATRIPVFAVKKKGEPSVAASGPVSAIAPNGPAKRWIWFDDFIDSGGTFKNAVSELWKAKVIEKPWPDAVLSYQRTKESAREWYPDSLSMHETIPNYPWAALSKQLIHEFCRRSLSSP